MGAIFQPSQPAFQPTPYATVNEALAELLAQVQRVLTPRFPPSRAENEGTDCARFVAMVLTGSLALGDFDPNTSDIDLLVVTDGMPAEAQLDALRAMHAAFDGSGSPWAGLVEVVYIPRKALRRQIVDATHYPQVEKGRALFLDRLEDGWLAQLYIVREHGITLAGPEPQTLLDPIDANEMRRMVARIPEMWLDQAHHDPSWLEWLAVRKNQAFVTLSLCRLLYTLEVGAVASKPGAARWAQGVLDARWGGLIEGALAGQHDSSAAAEEDVMETVALVEYVAGRFREWSYN